jgi:tetratricopeptide (TPR) repeat protein
MSQNMKERLSKEEQQPSRTGRFLWACLTATSYGLDPESDRAIIRAKAFMSRAESYTEAQKAEKGKALLIAGQYYMQGGRLDTATKVLESATEPLRLYFNSGTLDAHLSLAELYTTLGNAYELGGLPGAAELVRGRVAVITSDIERHFGNTGATPTFSDLNPNPLTV